ncbi:galactosyltransferase-related protein [Streptomyces triticirhizae]|uniref:galactosyltransferase-related protein n=1 Tax=Streptomyces triticirhizae TaxID=2483353 RepID=UPI0013159190|nr:galactosyltransferase-related protein [Streptomyces triticirhizae]
MPYPLTCRHLPRTARSSRAAARNAAIEAAGGELVLMVDADQVVGPRFVAEHIAYHRHDPCQWLPRDFFSENLNNLQTCWHLMFTCDVSVRREHLTAVGGFDEAYLEWGLEDTDLGYRLRAHGLRFALDPADRGLRWVDAMERFEYAARALAGG